MKRQGRLRVLNLEDDELDGEIVYHKLVTEGLDVSYHRVDTREAFLARLEAGVDVVLSDHMLPQFNSTEALKLVKERTPEVPFIIVSGLITEDLAVTLLREGAADYVLKDRLTRLGPAVRRAIRERDLRRAQAEADQARRATEALHLSVLASLNAHIAVLDAGGTIVAVNPAWEAFARANGDPELRHTGVGQSYVDVCRRAAERDATAQAALEGILRVLHGEAFSFTYEYPCHAPRRKRWYQLHVTPLIGFSGGVVIAHENVTDRYQDRTRLRRSESLLTAVAENSLDGLEVYAAVRAADGEIVDFERLLVNPRANAMASQATGVPDAQRRPALSLLARQEELVDVYRRVVETGEPAEWEVFYDHEGVQGWFNVTVVKVEDGVAVTLRDVTPLKEREETLRRANARFEALTKSAPGMIFQFVQHPDGSRQFPYLSRAAVRLFGRPLAELERGTALLDAIHPQDRPGFEASLEASAGTLAPWRWKGRIVVPGATRWVEGAAQPERQPDGSILWNGLILDVSARVAAEAALQQSQKQAAALFEHALDAILVFDDDGCYVDANPAASTLTGYSRDELLRLSLWDTFPPPDEANRQDLWNAFFEAGTLAGEYPLRCKDGTIRDVDYRAAAHILPSRHVVLLRDVTERKRAETDRRWLAAIVRSSNDAIIGMAPGGTVTSWNEAAEQLFGYTAGEMVGQPVDRLIPEDRRSERAQLYGELGHVQHPRRLDTLRLRKDGARLEVALSVAPVRDEAGQIIGAATIARDISMQKRFVREVLAAKRKAEEMNRLKSAFLTNMSHEIRTPLTGIIGFAEVLTDFVPEEGHEFVGYIRRNSERLLSTLTDVLELSQVESGSYTFNPDRVSLNDAVEKAAGPFRAAAAAKGLRLDVALADPPPPVWADAVALGRILHHLLGNAVKFTNEGGVAVSVLAPVKGRAAIQVRDTGVGIGHAFLPKLFTAFEQESSGENRDFEGSGLGLAIVRRLAEAMGGTVEVESERGKGSTFTLRLPLPPGTPAARQRALKAPARPGPAPNAEAPPHAEAPPRAAKAAAGPPTGRPDAPAAAEVPLPDREAPATPPRVLVLDDNEAARNLLRIMLEPECEVVPASGVDEALARAGAESFDLFVLDINLGERRTGIEAMHALRALPAHQRTPMIACTAHSLPGDEARFLKAGFQGYVGKPVRKTKLLAAVRAALDAQVRLPGDVVPEKQAVIELPPLPNTLPAVIQLLSGAATAPDVERLSEVLAMDPVTSAWVLRHVNSAFYGLRHSVATIDRAVTLLGFEPVCNLVLLEVLSRSFSDVSAGPPRDVYEYLTKTSIAAACFARDLAAALGVAHPETAFTAGMLHQVGRLALLSRAPVEYASTWNDGKGGLKPPALSRELLHFEADHVEVGAQVARLWELSPELTAPILFYHRAHQARLKNERPYVLLVAVGHAAGGALYKPGQPAEVLDEDHFDGSLRALASLSGRPVGDLLGLLNDSAASAREFVGLAFHD